MSRPFALFFAFALLLPAVSATATPEGEELFVQHRCVRCHTVGRGRFAGPDLKGVFDKHSRETVLLWITDPAAVYAAEGRAPVNEGFPPMPPTDVSPEDAEILADYIFSLRNIPPPPPGGGVISGTVINRTAEKPARNLTVTVNSFLGDRPVFSRSEKTDKDGGFIFRNLSWSAAHKLSVNAGGVMYETGGMVFKPAQNEIETVLPIYDPTGSDEFIGAELHHLIVEPFDGGAGVLEFVEMSNTGKTAFVSPEGETGGIPPGAENARIIHGAGGGESITLLPGASRVALSYTVPSNGGAAVFTKTLKYKTASFVVVSPALEGVSVSGLGNPARANGKDGKVFHRWSGENLAKGSEVTVTVSPARKDRPAWILPLIIFTVIIAGAVLFGRFRGGGAS